MNALKPVKVKLIDLKPYVGNPRHITQREMDSLKASLRTHGMVTTVVAREGSLELIGGHQRISALQSLAREGEKVPTYVWAVLVDVDDDAAKRMNVALNRVGGSFDEEMLAELFESLNVVDDETAQAMGYTADEIDALIQEFSDNGESDPEVSPEKAKRDLQEFANSVTLSISFSSVAERDAVKAWLMERAVAKNCKAGDILFSIQKARAEGGNRRRRKKSKSGV